MFENQPMCREDVVREVPFGMFIDIYISNGIYTNVSISSVIYTNNISSVFHLNTTKLSKFYRTMKLSLKKNM